MEKLVINNQVLPYKIINKNNKNTYFKFKPDGIYIHKSKYHTKNDIIKILSLNFNDYYNKYLNILKQLPSDNEIILEEKSYQLHIQQGPKFKYEINENCINVWAKKIDVSKIKKKIYLDYIKKMYQKIEEEVDQVLLKHNIYKRKISFNYFKTKFGSYHRNTDEIKLNIVLAKYHYKYLYYVIMHEYAHTIVFNHSKSYYLVLEKLMPDYKYYDKSLKNMSIYI